MIPDLISVAVGLAGLFFGGEWLVKGASRLAASFGISALVIGLTVVSFGTSAPELFVSLQAALQGQSDIAVGNVVGSNIANIGLILGVCGVITALPVHISLIRREIPIMIGASLLLYLMARDSQIGTADGLLLFAGIIAFTAAMVIISHRQRISAQEEAQIEALEGVTGSINRLLEFGRLALGLAVLLVGSNLTVGGAVGIARALGISELVIGITLVAVGTSLPELATTIIAAIKREPDIAVGNIVGSNIFNILSILGLTALARPIPVAERVIQWDLLVMIAFALLLLPFALNRALGRREALLLLLIYTAFILFTFASGAQVAV